MYVFEINMHNILTHLCFISMNMIVIVGDSYLFFGYHFISDIKFIYKSCPWVRWFLLVL